ncbi:hypothetical protein ASF35_06695 [Aeromicrobium sp. Leaf291]|nr:hypothetical protein ASF35_06695 [Aeromicrobium sp. Leaf291]
MGGGGAERRQHVLQETTDFARGIKAALEVGKPTSFLLASRYVLGDCRSHGFNPKHLRTSLYRARQLRPAASSYPQGATGSSQSFGHTTFLLERGGEGVCSRLSFGELGLKRPDVFDCCVAARQEVFRIAIDGIPLPHTLLGAQHVREAITRGLGGFRRFIRATDRLNECYLLFLQMSGISPLEILEQVSRKDLKVIVAATQLSPYRRQLTL